MILILICFFFFMSVSTFLLFGWDKHAAVYRKPRIPEVLLIALSVLLGAFGALCGMIIFNHKTKKKLFFITVPVLAVLHIAAFVILRVLGY